MNQKLKEIMTKAGYAAPELAGRAHVLSELLIEHMLEAIGDHQLQVPPVQRIKHSFGLEYHEPIEKVFEK
jgi:hypothetical protein